MAQITFIVAHSGKTFTRDVNLNADTVEGVITRLRQANEIGAPPPAPDGGVTIWKMHRACNSGNIMDNCTPGSGDGFNNGDTAYLVAVKKP